MELTQNRLQELLEYNPLTGVFTRRVNSGHAKAGAVAGTKHIDGYIMVGVGGDKYFAHRLAFLYMTGEWPISGVDHRNTIKSDNSWGNLRDCTQRENMNNPITKMNHVASMNDADLKAQISERQRGLMIGNTRAKGKNLGNTYAKKS
jgi:hypothetical protein